MGESYHGPNLPPAKDTVGESYHEQKLPWARATLDGSYLGRKLPWARVTLFMVVNRLKQYCYTLSSLDILFSCVNSFEQCAWSEKHCIAAWSDCACI